MEPALVSDNPVYRQNPGNYEHLCEIYTWRNECHRKSRCPRYHSPDRLPYLWLMQDDDGEWVCVTSSVNADLEKIFCRLNDLRSVQVTVPGISRIDFSKMSATVEQKGMKQSYNLKRLSTPSYVTSVPGVPLHFYTQWVWYRQERDGTYTPFIPGTLQYTLEEKYLNGQHTYYFEFEDLNLKVNMHSLPMVQENLDRQRVSKIVRRPVLVEKQEASVMSSLLLSSVPEPLPHRVPDHWTSVDHFQDFELVELRSDETEYAEVQRQFFSTMNAKNHSIENVFRVQNPGLWDNYCSARRAMTPRGQRPEDVEERQLFHGTPTPQSARGICANSFDFRRSGQEGGSMYGRGAYFSTTAHYSHSYTRPQTPLSGLPVRFMFLGKILVGQYTLGQPSYTKPPERHGLKMYDSCVNDMSNPTIFVIFALAQSYPEYLIEYTDSSKSADVAQPVSDSLYLPPRPNIRRSPSLLSLSGLVDYNYGLSASCVDIPSSGAGERRRKKKKKCTVS